LGAPGYVEKNEATIGGGQGGETERTGLTHSETYHERERSLEKRNKLGKKKKKKKINAGSCRV